MIEGIPVGFDIKCRKCLCQREKANGKLLAPWVQGGSKSHLPGCMTARSSAEDDYAAAPKSWRDIVGCRGKVTWIEQ